jgi:uncharacterized membrane protein YebE (DUF533 family)|tara:strand:+ start:123 stop:545 length:423 start_codon:yes stop_codon:yes gene_type:complete
VLKFNNFNERKVVMSRAKKAKETCMSNMYFVMEADGKITHEEKIMFMAACKSLGITEEEAEAHIERVISNPESLLGQTTRPKGAEECLKHLFASVMMMYADGHMHPEELKWCQVYAAALGIPKDTVSAMIEVVKKSKGRD